MDCLLQNNDLSSSSLRKIKPKDKNIGEKIEIRIEKYLCRGNETPRLKVNDSYQLRLWVDTTGLLDPRRARIWHLSFFGLV